MKLTQNLHINCIDLNERGLVFQRLIDMGFEHRGVDFYFKNVNVNHTQNFFMTATGGDIWRASEVLTGKEFISKYGKSEMKKSIEKAMAELKLNRHELSSALGMSRPYITKMLTCPQSEKTQARVVKMIDGLLEDKGAVLSELHEVIRKTQEDVVIERGIANNNAKISLQKDKTIKELNQALEYKDQLLAKNEDEFQKKSKELHECKCDILELSKTVVSDQAENSELRLMISVKQKSIEDKASELLDCKMDNSNIRTELKALKRENKDIQIHHAIVCVILIILVAWGFYV